MCVMYVCFFLKFISLLMLFVLFFNFKITLAEATIYAAKKILL